ncbi:MAG: DUF1573 domain-containing protein [Bacteroidales bacterium]|nr:DUF1573 domain-containing protein [Bacteroidales bacterium]
MLRYKLTNLDFDTMQEENGPVERRFIIYSEGSSPLRLISVKPGCGCTTADWTHTPIAPGDSGFIVVVYDPANRPGPFFKTIFVETNDPNNLQSYLSISGYVVPRPKTIEERFPGDWGSLRVDRLHTAFGDVFHHEERTDTLRVFNTASVPLSLKKPGKGSPSWYSLSLIPQKLNPGMEGRMVLHYKAARRGDWGLIYDTIAFRTSDAKDSLRFFTVGINILEDFSKLTEAELKGSPELRIDRTEIRFGSLHKGERVQDSVVLHNTGMQPLHVRRITSSCQCLQWDIDNQTIPPGGKATLKFTLDSSELLGRQHKVLTLITNAPAKQVIRISLIGTVG